MKNNYCTVCGEIKTVTIKTGILFKPIKITANQLSHYTVKRILKVYCAECGIMYEPSSIGK